MLGLRRVLTNLASYFLVSGAGLTLDYSVSWALSTLAGLSVPVAAASGYVAGMFLVYPLLARRVFFRRHQSFVLRVSSFAVSAGLGVLVTYFVSFFLHYSLGYGFHPSKTIAVIASFTLVLIFRRFVVFGPFR